MAALEVEGVMERDDFEDGPAESYHDEGLRATLLHHEDNDEDEAHHAIRMGETVILLLSDGEGDDAE